MLNDTMGKLLSSTKSWHLEFGTAKKKRRWKRLGRPMKLNEGKKKRSIVSQQFTRGGGKKRRGKGPQNRGSRTGEILLKSGKACGWRRTNDLHRRKKKEEKDR